MATMMISTNPQQLISPRVYFPSSKPHSKFPPQFYPSTPATKVGSRISSPRRGSVRLVATDSGFTADVGNLLGDVTIFTAAGEPVAFKDLWDQKEGVAVVALLRHFGCPCCWELASTLKESKEKFDTAGVKLIAVGVGTPNKARILAERLSFPMDCLYADPDRKAKVFSRFEALQKAVENYTIEATPDDRSSVLQQGGMFVLKGNQLVYGRKDEGRDW